ncbi:amyloid-beta A4 precursor protein-binding family A member 3 [Cheilinus undulatus]|uniref:amyloid-beta A4 precursor protein-binding family A member 3 n=1 Tax=Cheilinus undulatus TaxID=241271 RepID=UPI001BD49C1D|nr:amyloid-beta A4 precursor protein-binding family A member 3 [Cheilinus undulatus]
MDSDVCPADQAASVPSDTSCPSADPADLLSGADLNRQDVLEPTGLEAEDLDSYNPIEPPPLDWRSDSSSEAGSADDLDDSSFPPAVENLDEASPSEPVLIPLDVSLTVASPSENQQELLGNTVEQVQDIREHEEEDEAVEEEEVRVEDLEGDREYQEETLCDVDGTVSEEEVPKKSSGDEDHSRIHTLLSQLQMMGEEPHPSHGTPPHLAQHHYSSRSELEGCSPSLITDDSSETTGLLFSESHHRDLLGLLQVTEIGPTPTPTHLPHRGEVDAVVSVSYNQEDAQKFWGHYRNGRQQRHRDDSIASLPDEEYPEPVWMKLGEEPPEEEEAAGESEQSVDQLSYKDVPGPCDPEDLLDGVIFGAKYLGSTQLKSEKNPSTNARMTQAQEAVDRIKAPEGESQPMTEVDLFISTQRIKVLTADTQV